MGLVLSGPCGGIGGSSFYSSLDAKTNLLAVRVWAREDCIAAIQINYELDGQISDSHVWGNNQQAGTTYHEVVLKAGEFMASITGTVGTSKEGIVVVRSLSFVTNLTTYGRFGNQTSDAADHPFNLSAGTEGKIAGFYGYSGTLVDAIGVLVKPNTSLVKEGPCGGAGGGVFTMDMNADTNLLGVRVWHRNDCVAAIQVNYQIAGQQGDNWTTPWGNGQISGATLSEISFGQGRSLKSISGYMGNSADEGIFVVKALSFVTDNGVTYGPYGKEEGAQFAFGTGVVGKIVGFHGRSGQLLDALGVIILN